MRSLEQRFTVTYGYRVHFTSGVFATSNWLLRDAIGQLGDHPRPVLFAVDEGVQRHHPRLLSAIEAYCRHHADVLDLAGPPILLPGGEAAKNSADQVVRMLSAIDQAGLCRHSFVLAVGGGAVLDLVGYAAATAHRGIRLIRVPTTVLAQNDSGVGVKNGINAFGKKNWLGTFVPPHAVFIDFDFLPTLSDRDWRSGIAEAVKVGLIKDALFFDFLEARAAALAQREMADMQTLVHRCAELHLGHIAASGDPLERGSARPLDFGHWAAHKLEQVTGYEIRHGEAVAIGIALDCTYSWLAGFLPESAWRRILGTLSTVGFRLYAPELSRDLDDPTSPRCILGGLTEFRQHIGGELTVMLLRGVGEAFDVHAMDEDLVRQSIAVLRELDHKRTAEMTSKGETTWKPKPTAAR